MNDDRFLIKSSNLKFVKFDKLIWNDVRKVYWTSNINGEVFDQWGLDNDLWTNFSLSNAVIKLPLLLSDLPVEKFITWESSFITVLKNQMVAKSFIESVLSGV